LGIDGLVRRKDALPDFSRRAPMVSYTVYAERRVSALIQDRIGPNRTGFPGFLYWASRKTFRPSWGDLASPSLTQVKFLLKEDFVPAHVNKPYFWLAPCLAMIPAIVLLSAIPVRKRTLRHQTGGRRH
jgi:NADH-quinone oxidoreductase subunit H